MDKEERINDLQNKINFWQRKLEQTKNSSEGALLLDKINNAKKEILELNNNKNEQKIKHHIDAPAMADSTPSNNLNLERGQIMNSGDVFVATL